MAKSAKPNVHEIPDGPPDATGLTPRQHRVLAVIRDLAAEKRTMVIVTHQMDFARDVADRTIFMDGGVIVEQGPSRQLLAAPREERTRRFLARSGVLQ